MTIGPLFLLAAFACLVTLGVLMAGIYSFAKGGEFNRRNANKIMRLRLLVQFVAVLLILAFVAVAS
jgi:uncharacterized membrane protein YidH (DUF202 family)